MKAYLRTWNFMRLLRLALGMFIFIQGIIAKDWAFITMGGIFAALPLLNMGCGSGTCTPPKNSNTKSTIEDVNFEEIK